MREAQSLQQLQSVKGSKMDMPDGPKTSRSHTSQSNGTGSSGKASVSAQPTVGWSSTDLLAASSDFFPEQQQKPKVTPAARSGGIAPPQRTKDQSDSHSDDGIPKASIRLGRPVRTGSMQSADYPLPSTGLGPGASHSFETGREHRLLGVAETGGLSRRAPSAYSSRGLITGGSRLARMAADEGGGNSIQLSISGRPSDHSMDRESRDNGQISRSTSAAGSVREQLGMEDLDSALDQTYFPPARP